MKKEKKKKEQIIGVEAKRWKVEKKKSTNEAGTVIKCLGSTM
jgi:hypothetical protein